VKLVRISISRVCIGAIIGAMLSPAAAWSQGKLDQQLTAQYTITTPTADNTDIVTAGTVLVLQKRGLTTGDATSNVVFSNSYKDGQIKSGVAGTLSKISHFGIPGIPSAPSNTANRTFVNGEKVYVTAIQIKGNQIIFSLISDAYDNVRYKGTLSFEFSKKVIESDDLAKVQQTLAEVFTIDTSAKTDANAASAAGQQAPAAPAPPDPVIAPIAPPPPPANQPPAPIGRPGGTPGLGIGQTPDQVIAILGQPQKMAKLTGKEIYFYRDLKVTFKNGKVSDVE
jgi:hypothetical protein